MSYYRQHGHHHQHHHRHRYRGYGNWPDPSSYGDEDDQSPDSQEMEYESSAPLQEVEEMEYASELMDIRNEEELEEFLGDLIKTVGKAAGGLIRSPIGQALTGTLKSVAKQALPMVGGALGSMVAPGIGTALGSQLGSMAGGLFEFEGEGEGEDYEQAEFNAARRFVSLASKAAENAAFAPADLPPHEVAHQSVVTAAEHVAPGVIPLLGGLNGFDQASYEPRHGQQHHGPHEHHGHHGHHGHGHWVREGDRIVLYGV